MAFADLAFYYSFGDGATTGYYAATAWATGTVKNCGDIVRQNTTPTVGNERTFVCTTGGTTHATTEPTWVVTRGATTTDNTVTWQECSGHPALNGDKTNTKTWTQIKNTAITKGAVIKSDNGNFILICSVAGTAGNGAEPSWSAYTTAGATTADNTVTWKTLKDAGNNYSNWASPAARLQVVTVTLAPAGLTIYAASNSAETIATTTTYALAGTLANPTDLLCVNQAGSVPPVAADITTGASISATAAVGIAFSGQALIQGLTLQTNTTGTTSIQFGASNGPRQIVKNCTINIRSSAAGALVPGASVSWTEFENCTVTFAATTNTIQFNASSIFRWRTGTMTCTAVPATLIVNSAAVTGMQCLFEGIDMSSFTGLLTANSSSQGSVPVILKDCKIGALTLASATPAAATTNIVDLIRCSTAANNYRTYRSRFGGTHDTETTIVRTGGATDGTQAQSWKIITKTTNSISVPFECVPIRIWNDTTGSAINVNVYGIWGGGAVPNNNDIWFDVEYLSTDAGALATCGLATPLTTAAGHSSDSSTWGGSTTAFKMTKQITPQQKGYIYVYVKAGAVSSTFYIDPKVELA